MVPPPTRAPAAGQAVEHAADRLDAGHDVGQRGRAWSRPRRPAPRPSPTKSNSGWAVIAVVVSMAPRPVRAWLATAWAGQNPAAVRARRGAARPGRRAARRCRPAGLGSWPGRARPGGRRRAGPGPTAVPVGGDRAERRAPWPTRSTAATSRPAGHLAEGVEHVGPPGLVDVVLERARRRACGPRAGTRARASTVPSPSAATAFTDVVPMSIPTVTRGPRGHI